MKSSFSIADTESLQATNNEQQRNGLGVARLELSHRRQYTAQLVSLLRVGIQTGDKIKENSELLTLPGGTHGSPPGYLLAFCMVA